MASAASFVVFVSSLTLVACSSAVDEAPAANASAAPACAEGETRCEGDLLAACAGGAFAAPTPCEGEAVCRDGACREPSAEQLAQATELASMLAYLEENTAWSGPLDWDALRSEGRRRILGGDGSNLAYVTALYRAFIAVPQGHQTFFLESGCGKSIPMLNASQRGACGQPHSRGIVVTNVRATNALGLAKGDLVTRVGDARGNALLERLAERPLYAVSHPSTSNRDAVTAATFTDLLVAGEEIEVESPNGQTRTLKVPDVPLSLAAAKTALSCSDPFSRAHVVVESSLRPDGVGVIRLPGFTDPEQAFPTSGDPADYDAYKQKFEAKILAAFDKVKSAPAIVWDLRGNGGGMTQVGLDIASGFAGARGDLLSYCVARIPKSSPPQFTTFRGAEYALAPGGPFAYAGKVAVLIDGQDYSAADYFPLVVRSRTDATLVGAPTAGAFGATSETKAFKGPPAFDVGVDMNHCLSADDDQPLEGKSAKPHVAVEYSPSDLAAGRDTMLEKAASLLLGGP